MSVDEDAPTQVLLGAQVDVNEALFCVRSLDTPPNMSPTQAYTPVEMPSPEKANNRHPRLHKATSANKPANRDSGQDSDGDSTTQVLGTQAAFTLAVRSEETVRVRQRGERLMKAVDPTLSLGVGLELEDCFSETQGQTLTIRPPSQRTRTRLLPSKSSASASLSSAAVVPTFRPPPRRSVNGPSTPQICSPSSPSASSSSSLSSSTTLSSYSSASVSASSPPSSKSQSVHSGSALSPISSSSSSSSSTTLLSSPHPDSVSLHDRTRPHALHKTSRANHDNHNQKRYRNKAGRKHERESEPCDHRNNKDHNSGRTRKRENDSSSPLERRQRYRARIQKLHDQRDEAEQRAAGLSKRCLRMTEQIAHLTSHNLTLRQEYQAAKVAIASAKQKSEAYACRRRAVCVRVSQLHDYLAGIGPAPSSPPTVCASGPSSPSAREVGIASVSASPRLKQTRLRTVPENQSPGKKKPTKNSLNNLTPKRPKNLAVPKTDLFGRPVSPQKQTSPKPARRKVVRRRLIPSVETKTWASKEEMLKDAEMRARLVQRTLSGGRASNEPHSRKQRKSRRTS